MWAIVDSGWEYPTKTGKVSKDGCSSDDVKIEKSMSEWTVDENTKSTNNQKALNSIFTTVSFDKFHLISYSTSTKQAWDILQVTHEGTIAVQESKLQQFMQHLSI